MKKLFGLLHQSRFTFILSVALAFLMVISLLPHDVLAQNQHTAIDQIVNISVDDKTGDEDNSTLIEMIASDDANDSDNATLVKIADETEPPQIITIKEAIDIRSSSCRVGGSLVSMGSAEMVMVFFQYGEKTDYGLLTEPIKMNTSGDFNAILSQLEPNRFYHFRLW